MDREVKRVERPRLVTEVGEVTYLQDPVTEMMDRLTDLET
jgi:hypothetical protein